jgi:hypothetical protein
VAVAVVVAVWKQALCHSVLKCTQLLSAQAVPAEAMFPTTVVTPLLITRLFSEAVLVEIQMRMDQAEALAAARACGSQMELKPVEVLQQMGQRNPDLLELLSIKAMREQMTQAQLCHPCATPVAVVVPAELESQHRAAARQVREAMRRMAELA